MRVMKAFLLSNFDEDGDCSIQLEDCLHLTKPTTVIDEEGKSYQSFKIPTDVHPGMELWVGLWEDFAYGSSTFVAHTNMILRKKQSTNFSEITLTLWILMRLKLAQIIFVNGYCVKFMTKIMFC